MELVKSGISSSNVSHAVNMNGMETTANRIISDFSVWLLNLIKIFLVMDMFWFTKVKLSNYMLFNDKKIRIILTPGHIYTKIY